MCSKGLTIESSLQGKPGSRRSRAPTSQKRRVRRGSIIPQGENQAGMLSFLGGWRENARPLVSVIENEAGEVPKEGNCSSGRGQGKKGLTPYLGER